MSEPRILVVEDDEERIAIFRDDLGGFALDLADSVEGAAKHLEGPRYDLVFLDHDLEHGARVYIDPEEPGTGYQIAKLLAARPEYREVPVVVHSFNWFGANRIVKELPNAVYVPFGIYPLKKIAWHFLEDGLDAGLRNLAKILRPPP